MMQTECTFLGTGAADFALLKKLNPEGRFDKNARRSCSFMIGQTLLIDCGPHVMQSLEIAKKDISKITDLFVTHFHADHFSKDNAEAIAAGKAQKLRLWCKKGAILPAMNNIEIRYTEEGVRYPVNQSVSVTAVEANHEKDSFPQHYVFDIGGKKLMYATDGAWILNTAMKYLKGEGVCALVIDCTCGEGVGDYRVAEHNSISMVRLMLPSLITNGVISPNARVFLTHIAPSLHKPHEEIQKSVQNDGLTVAFDGMTFTL